MFKTQNFCHIASNNRNQVKVGVFVYRTTDDIDTVSANGYFNERIIDINLHDLIIHEQVNPSDKTDVKYNMLCVTERTLDNVNTIVVSQGGGGSGTMNYNDLLNKPAIDGVTLTKDSTAEDLGLSSVTFRIWAEGE